jgi:hypothetical protein
LDSKDFYSEAIPQPVSSMGGESSKDGGDENHGWAQWWEQWGQRGVAAGPSEIPLDVLTAKPEIGRAEACVMKTVDAKGGVGTGMYVDLSKFGLPEKCMTTNHHVLRNKHAADGAFAYSMGGAFAYFIHGSIEKGTCKWHKHKIKWILSSPRTGTQGTCQWQWLDTPSQRQCCANNQCGGWIPPGAQARGSRYHCGRASLGGRRFQYRGNKGEATEF